MVEITTEEIRKQIELTISKISDIPTLPLVYARVASLLENPKTAARDVAETIQSDPAIASKVLKIANSPFYGFPQRITTISHAIVVLGFSSIKNIVLSCSILTLFRQNGEAQERVLFDYKGFWKHCVAVAAFSKIFGKRAFVQNPEEAFLAGLLHDLGKMIEFKFLPSEAKELVKITSTGKTLGQAELEIFGFTHADVSAWLYEKWNLSKLYIEVARCHHNPAISTFSQVICNAVHVADVFARGLGIGWPGDESIPKLQKSALEKLKIKEEDYYSIIHEGVNELNKSRVFLESIS